MEGRTVSATQKNEKVKDAEVVVEEVEVLSTIDQADKITRQFVLWSAGGGLIPVPFVDIAAVYAAQVTMVTKMSKVYGIPFSEHKFKNVLMPLFGTLGIVSAATGILASAIKVIPGIGNLVSSLSLPVMAGAITYATGSIFASHFEAGGTLLDFNPEKMKEHYKKLFAEGKNVAKDAANA